MPTPRPTSATPPEISAQRRQGRGRSSETRTCVLVVGAGGGAATGGGAGGGVTTTDGAGVAGGVSLASFSAIAWPAFSTACSASLTVQMSQLSETLATSEALAP